MAELVKCLRLTTFCAAICLAAAPGSAGETGATTGIDAGQLRLIEGLGVQHDWEDLYISPDEVRVSHQFTNGGSEEVVTVVAMALAAIDFEVSTDFAVDARDPQNILGFDLTVDGAKVAPDIDITAVRGGINITPVLIKHGVPLIPFAAFPGRGWDAYYDRIGELSDAARADLAEVDALAFDDPLWTAQVIYYWTVKFPPGRPVEMSYRYVPVPATTVLTREMLSDRETAKRYCVDKEFVAAAARKAGSAGAGAPATSAAQFIRYVMVLPDVPSPPIGRFYLTVDRGRSDTLMSMCASGAAKTGETAIRMERFDYVPDSDVDILFIRRLDTR